MNAEDERFSLRIALAVMVVLSALASIAYVWNLNPFALSFNISFVYLPTGILIMAAFSGQRRTIADSSAS